MSTALGSVFLTAFLAATVLPFYSEVVLAAAMSDPDINRLTLWTVATLGNTLGGAFNWWLGRFANRYRDRRWFPATQGQMDKAEKWFNRYGIWSLLFTWLPIGGDALTVIAGILRVRFDVFFVLVAIGKGARYAVVIAGVDALVY